MFNWMKTRHISEQQAKHTSYLPEQFEGSGSPPLRHVSASILDAKYGANQAS